MTDKVSSIILQYYTAGSDVARVLDVHSRQVAGLALALAERFQKQSGQAVDMAFVEEASMLHDIGIFLTNAPGIHCHGTEPYIRHGILGARLLDEMGMPRHARVCERHTGSGITASEVVAQGLPLPVKDYLPLTIEEKLVCYADTFFSKTHLGETPRDFETLRAKMQRFGNDAVTRFDQMHHLFGEPPHVTT